MFVWRYLDVGGAETGRSDRFEDQDGAEAWLSGSWQELFHRGVETVELVEVDAGHEEVRYRMGLRPESGSEG